MDNRRNNPYKSSITADRTGYPARVTVYPKPPGHMARSAYRPLPEQDSPVINKPEVPLQARGSPRQQLPYKQDIPRAKSVSPNRPIVPITSPYPVCTAPNAYAQPPYTSGGMGNIPPHPGIYVTSSHSQTPTVTPSHPCATHSPQTRQPKAGKRSTHAHKEKIDGKDVEFSAEVIPHVQARVPPNSPYWVDMPETEFNPDPPPQPEHIETIYSASHMIKGQSYMGLAVVVTVCFNCPIGIFAIIASMSALREFEAGNAKAGKVKASWSLLLSMFGMILTVAIMMTLVYHMAYTDYFEDYGY